MMGKVFVAVGKGQARFEGFESQRAFGVVCPDVVAGWLGPKPSIIEQYVRGKKF